MCTSMRLYKQIKTTIERSTYLDILEAPKYRKVISQLRLSSHKLAIETGRHNKISLNGRKCTHCTLNDIEDEFHFALMCPFYSNIRNLYVPSYFRNHPSVYKFISLLNTDKQQLLVKLATYCVKAHDVRNQNIAYFTFFNIPL